MKNWWMNLEVRERILIYVAGALAIFFVAWQFVMVPTIEDRRIARADLSATTTRLNILQEAYQGKLVLGSVSTPSQPTLSSDAFKTSVTQSASEKGISISRLQTDQDNALGIIIEDVDPRLAFFWLNDIEARLGGVIERLSIEQAGNGNARVSVDIKGPVS